MDLSFLAHQDFWSGVQSFLTSIAIVVGGIWFFTTRRRYPKAEVDHRIWTWITNTNERLIRVLIVLENKGEVLLEPGEIFVRLHHVFPLSGEVLEQIPDMRNTPPNKKASLEWSPYDAQSMDCKKELEPNESDELWFYFLIPAEIQTVLVYSFLENKHKKGRHTPIGWSKSSIHNLVDKENEDNA